MKLRHFIFSVTAALLLANGLYSYLAYCTPQAGRGAIEEKLEILMQTMELIRRNHPDGEKLAEEQLLTDAIRGMTLSLDPFSEYMPAPEYQEFNEESTGSFGGVGVRIETKDGKVVVVSPIDGTPAAKAGILAGDEIAEVNGEDARKANTDDISRKLRGKAGTEVEVGIRRAGSDEIIRYRLTRAEIPIASVEDVHVIAGTDVGYLRVLEFTQNVPAEFEAALHRLESQATGGLVIDLRNNPGGLLESARLMCSHFLPAGQLVVSVEGRGPNGNTQELTGDGYKFPQVPLVILINGGSASAAEIMAACLNDHDRAGLVGEKSFGKGSVQNVMAFPDGSALKLTIARYYTKSRRAIHGVGIRPELERNMTRREYIRLYRTHDVARRDEIDPHLTAALEYIRDYQGRPSLYRQAHPEPAGDDEPDDDGQPDDGDDEDEADDEEEAEKAEE